MFSRVERIVFCCVLASIPILMLLATVKSDQKSCEMRLMFSLQQLQIPNFNTTQETIDYVSKQINAESCRNSSAGNDITSKIYDLIVNDFYIPKIFLVIYTVVHNMVWGQFHRDYYGY